MLYTSAKGWIDSQIWYKIYWDIAKVHRNEKFAIKFDEVCLHWKHAYSKKFNQIVIVVIMWVIYIFNPDKSYNIFHDLMISN